MVALPGYKNSNFCPPISLLWIVCLAVILIRPAQAQPREITGRDSLIHVTHRAQILVDSLIADEKKTESLIRQLRHKTEEDSVLLLEQLKLQNEQRAKLLALSRELDDTREQHEALVEEIGKIRPKMADILIPAGGGIVAFALTNGATEQKALAGVGVFAVLITLRHFGIY